MTVFRAVIFLVKANRRHRKLVARINAYTLGGKA